MPAGRATHVDREGRVCTVCLSYKLWEEFDHKAQGVAGRSPSCKACCKAAKAASPAQPTAEDRRRYRLAYKERHPERVATADRKQKLSRNYGITPEQYGEMLELQGGVCAICGEPETKTRNGEILAMPVDHNHLTGEVRGLLCSRHNLALGAFNDDIDLLRAAIRYLEAS